MLNENKQSAANSSASKQGFSDSIESSKPSYSYSQTTLGADRVSNECTVVCVAGDGTLSSAAATLDQATNGLLSALVEVGTITGKLGSSIFVPVTGTAGTKSILVIGSGSWADLTSADFKKLIETVHGALTTYGQRSATVFLSELQVRGGDAAWKLRQQVICFEAVAYRYRSEEPGGGAGQLRDITLAAADENMVALEDGRAIADGVRIARALGDTPPNICTPVFLADFATAMANRFPAMTAEVLGEEEMRDLGMNVMLSVGQGSAQPSKFVVLKYSGSGDKMAAPIVLIGKGVTFDTGGTALKTRQSMSLMKYDMCGAAAVLAVMKSAAALELPLNIIGVCACAENMPGSEATRPSDTVKSLSGKTVEVINPDAEGRLLLCDALSYVERFKPELVIDLATLTGASLIALGRHYSALFCNDDDLLAELITAGDVAMDKVWQLPLSEEDNSQLDSEFADLANMGDGTAGCIVAALFLSHFATAYPWAHLDISGTAKSGGDKVGATGRPVSLLLHFLLQRARTVSD